MWFVNYGELVGKSHGPKQTPCQDKALCLQKNNVNVAALSDGCGSSEISQYGSAITTEVLCEMFTERFDEIYQANIIESRKMIVDGIVLALKKFIEENESIFSEYKEKHINKFNGFIKKRSEEEFFLDSLNATALFTAEKEGKFIIGQIGDGAIGAVINNNLRIIMEEYKQGEVNGTFYPTNIYSLAKENPDWYGCRQFQLKKPMNADIKAFVLTSDGVDSFFDLRVPFEVKYTPGVNKLFRCTVDAETFEEGKKVLDEQFLPALVNGSRSRDDCSVAVMVQKDYYISPDGYTITKKERPVIKEEVVKPTQNTINEELSYEDITQEEYDKKISEYTESLIKLIGEDCTTEYLTQIGYVSSTKKINLKIIDEYLNMLTTIKNDGYFTYEKGYCSEKIVNIMFNIDTILSKEEKDNGKILIYRK